MVSSKLSFPICKALSNPFITGILKSNQLVIMSVWPQSLVPACTWELGGLSGWKTHDSSATIVQNGFWLNLAGMENFYGTI